MREGGSWGIWEGDIAGGHIWYMEGAWSGGTIWCDSLIWATNMWSMQGVLLATMYV